VSYFDYEQTLELSCGQTHSVHICLLPSAMAEDVARPCATLGSREGAHRGGICGTTPSCPRYTSPGGVQVIVHSSSPSRAPATAVWSESRRTSCMARRLADGE
jgi:hypothetical protein